MSSPQFIAPMMEDGSIADLAERARQLLVCCQEITDEESRFLAGEQLARLNAWVSNHGVFKAQHASLDYKLRTSPLRYGMAGSLKIVCGHVLAILKGSPEVSGEEYRGIFAAPRSNVLTIARNLLSKSTSDESMRVKKLELVEDMITRINQLSLGAQREMYGNGLKEIPELLYFDTQDAILPERRDNGANMEPPVDDLHSDIGSEFEDFVRQALKYRCPLFSSRNEEDLDDEQKGYRLTLLERCSSIISIRRRELEYFRSHQNKLHSVYKNPKINHTHILSDSPSNHAWKETFVSESIMTNFEPPLASSAISSSAVVEADEGFGGGRLLDVPPPPKLVGGEKEKSCPYCYLMLPAKTFSVRENAKHWERHLMEDLRPWKRHLSQPHYRGWQCSSHAKHANSCATDEAPFRFSTVEEVQKHNKAVHANYYLLSAEEIFKGGQLVALPQWCFICLESLPQPDELLRHMADHFKSLSLLALPWRDRVASLSDKCSNNEDDERAASLDETEEPAMGLTEKFKKQRFASMLLAINNIPIAHQDRLEKWAYDCRWREDATTGIRETVIKNTFARETGIKNTTVKSTVANDTVNKATVAVKDIAVKATDVIGAFARERESSKSLPYKGQLLKAPSPERESPKTPSSKIQSLKTQLSMMKPLMVQSSKAQRSEIQSPKVQSPITRSPKSQSPYRNSHEYIHAQSSPTPRARSLCHGSALASGFRW
ncbi:uncharacterized protein TRIVIDRAFT_221367 [Trichoderma virens Gv29-8]|uniref:Oxidoreductase acuF-like C2H2 type zinc-finger domain-containing protein n=1 Tax=Hypocrea virens (strain Gv29-8 / FGSC 10586) TaxID=413071 RepID=G9MQQ4_HYPVG|nr:uncharacterized protein TRIVIDRAFT_221367 [Trichoderma virens Gv29-8]EHK24121.1 hypothetical protein TRIVIDRAFT_221367 [Trichoderma virens Gv29-8]